ncbi:G5 domain-containing protein [Terribacillus sp. 179-K 1B1 HS]|uniref:G5 domain-containing protein n=1 Tax=Terribacillus sp. 179-K 1B1 HS TaxID=3142388 RepID=UPI0039A39090
MKKSVKIALAVGSAIALSTTTPGFLNSDYNKAYAATEQTFHTATSVVDWMKANGLDSSFENRKKLAEQNGIVNYKGTASQNIQLLGNVKEDGVQALHTNTSVVDWLKANGLDSSFNNRKALAEKHGIPNYKGSAAQNIQLLSVFKETGVQNNITTNNQAHTELSIVDWMKANGMNSTFSNRQNLANEYGIANYTGTSEQNLKLLGILNGSIAAPEKGQAKVSTPTSKPVTKPVTKEKKEISKEEKAVVTYPSKPKEDDKKPVVEKPVKEEPTGSKPTKPVEEKPEQKPVEEKPVDVPVVKPTEPVEEKPVVEEPTQPETPVESDPVVEEPVEEKPTTPTEPVEEPSLEPTEPVETPTQPDEEVTEPTQPEEPVEEPVVQEPVITYENSTSTEAIAFETVEQQDPTLEKGKTVVTQEGQDGVRTITFKETYKDGKLVSKEQVSSEITKAPVNKIVKVGTKEVVPANSILSGAGVFTKAGSSYVLNDAGYGEIIQVSLNGEDVSNIRYNGNAYISLNMSKQDLIDLLGEEEGTKEYNDGQSKRNTIEKAVRAASNAVYGSGSSKANSLYNQIIQSESFNKSF